MHWLLEVELLKYGQSLQAWVEKKTILEYNSGFDKKEKVSLVPLGNQNGIGLALKF